ncbi:MAG: hypothetical protein JXR64_03700 [Spirochaetales bacterium]|nr:hypothetical protein [Spirochaetales bacterium]
MEPVVVVDQTLCTGCTACIDVCIPKVLYIDDFSGLCRVRHQEKCDKIGECLKVCKPGAIKINR